MSGKLNRQNFPSNCRSATELTHLGIAIAITTFGGRARQQANSQRQSAYKPLKFAKTPLAAQSWTIALHLFNTEALENGYASSILEQPA